MISWRLRILSTAVALCAMLASCGGTDEVAVYSGSFEAQEVLVSSEANGRIISWAIDEGQEVTQGQLLGEVDSTLLVLQREELAEQVKAMEAQMSTEALDASAARILRRRLRGELACNATQQDGQASADADLSHQRNATMVLPRLGKSAEQMVAQRMALAIRDEQLRYRIRQCRALAPVKGTVLQRYVSAGEVVGARSPLVRLADMSQLTLRVYMPYEGLQRVALGDSVPVHIDSVSGLPASFTGRVSWISQEAEFTPRTVQTPAMRESLVYAVKVSVPNPDGALKRGMYGEIRLPSAQR